MRRALLLLLALLLAACAGRRPVPFHLPARAWTTAREALVRYEVRYPWRKHRGEAFLLVGEDWLYVEGTSPLGLVLFQGVLRDGRGVLVSPPQETVFLLLLRGLSARAPWGRLLLGEPPEGWSVEAAYASGEEVEAILSPGAGLSARAVFRGEALRALSLSGRRGELRLRYERREGRLVRTTVALPALHLTLTLEYLSMEPTEEAAPGLRVPPGFRTRVFTLEL